MVSIRFFPVDIDYTEENNESVIRIFGRTEDGKRIAVFDESLNPYFWVIAKRDVDLEKFRKKIER